MVDYNYIMERDLYICQRCGKNRNQAKLEIAHRIKQGKKTSKKNQTVNFIKKFMIENYDIYIKKSDAIDIIDHEYNLVVSCDICNSSFNLFNKPVPRDELLIQILIKRGIINA